MRTSRGVLGLKRSARTPAAGNMDEPAAVQLRRRARRGNDAKGRTDMRLQRTLTSVLVPALFALGACVPARRRYGQRAGRPVRPATGSGARGHGLRAPRARPAPRALRAPPGPATRARRALRAAAPRAGARPAPRARALPEASVTGTAGTGRPARALQEPAAAPRAQPPDAAERAARRAQPADAADRAARREATRRHRRRRGQRRRRAAREPSEREPPGPRAFTGYNPNFKEFYGDDCHGRRRRRT